MTAILATLDMPTQRRRTATLDRDHGAAPRGGQRRAVLITIGRPEVAEHVRHFQPLAGHGTRPSGGQEIRHGWHESRQSLQRTGRGADLAGGDTQITRRGVQAAMSQQP